MLTSLLRPAVLLVFLLGATTVAQAASDQQQAERKIEEGAQALLDGMRMLLKTIPWYGQPQVKPNGDIIIPRRDGPFLPEPRRAPTPSDKDDGDSDSDTKRL
jgi:hypothetical protein